jgi:signal peptidase I
MRENNQAENAAVNSEGSIEAIEKLDLNNVENNGDTSASENAAVIAEDWIEPKNSHLLNDENAEGDETCCEINDEITISKPSKIEQLTKERKRKAIIAKIISVAAWTAGICLLLLCFSNLYQQVFNPDGYTGLFGIGEAVVSSNSMEPKLYTNDLIFYKAAQMSEIEVGDTIIYKKSDAFGNTMLIVHKVEEIGNGYVTTKGLNNSVADDPISISAIVGKYMFKISQAGILLNALQSKWAPAIIILTMFAILSIRIGVYCLRKRHLIDKISNNDDNRVALNHFFDI